MTRRAHHYDDAGDLSQQEIAESRRMRARASKFRGTSERSAACTGAMADLPRCERYAIVEEWNECAVDGGPCALCLAAADYRAEMQRQRDASPDAELLNRMVKEEADRMRADRARFGKGNG